MNLPPMATDLGPPVLVVAAEVREVPLRELRARLGRDGRQAGEWLGGLRGARVGAAEHSADARELRRGLGRWRSVQRGGEFRRLQCHSHGRRIHFHAPSASCLFCVENHQ